MVFQQLSVYFDYYGHSSYVIVSIFDKRRAWQGKSSQQGGAKQIQEASTLLRLMIHWTTSGIKQSAACIRAVSGCETVINV